MESCDPLAVSSDQDVSLLSEARRLQVTRVYAWITRWRPHARLSYTHLSSLQHLPLIENLHGINSLCVLHLHHGNLRQERDVSTGRERERMHLIGCHHNSQSAVRCTFVVSLYTHTHTRAQEPDITSAQLCLQWPLRVLQLKRCEGIGSEARSLINR